MAGHSQERSANPAPKTELRKSTQSLFMQDLPHQKERLLPLFLVSMIFITRSQYFYSSVTARPFAIIYKGISVNWVLQRVVAVCLF